jgi:hypothetical protein
MFIHTRDVQDKQIYRMMAHTTGLEQLYIAEREGVSLLINGNDASSSFIP